MTRAAWARDRLTSHLSSNGRGIDGALLDLEYQRIELIKFNLFDTSGTYEDYVRGRDGVGGPALKVWPQMRLPKGHPAVRRGRAAIRRRSAAASSSAPAP